MNRPIHESMAICFKENIKIYPIIYDKSTFKIEVNYNGRKKVGEKLYGITSDQKKMQYRIIELYNEFADKIQSRG